MSSELILLVDDEPSIVQLARMYLERENFRVETAGDGEAALEAVRRLSPQLVVLDVMLPKLDGLEAIRQMRADPVLISTPILALTARAMPGDRERCLDAGANDYLSKPVNLKEFVSAVRRLVKA